MRKGCGELRFRSGGRDAYARVCVEILVRDARPGHDLVVREPDDGRHFFFQDSARAGVRYGLARLGRKVPMGLEIAITDVQVALSDTNEMMVIYAAAHAVWDAWGSTPDLLPEVDEQRWTMEFPF